MDSAGSGEDHEKLAEPWVQQLEELWESIYDPDELAAMHSEPREPLDRFLYEAWRLLRRVGGQITLRVASNFPTDENLLGEAFRQTVHEALRHFGAARVLIADAVGEHRIEELEQETLRRLVDGGDAIEG